MKGKNVSLKYFNIISIFFVATIMILNTVATKLFSLDPLIFTGGIDVYDSKTKFSPFNLN